ncbi:glycoside hydrolase family 99-like domain-containing protein [Pseudomonas caspiana]
MKHGEIFFQTYCAGDFTGKIVVDVGAQDVNGSLRKYSPEGATYIGIDFIEGGGVDIVIDDPYSLPFENESVDVIVCSSVFEHSDFFWLLYLECLRILKPSGLLYVNAPSNGMVHRYPVDSWRFYPDCGLSLAKWAQHNGYQTVLLESFIGEKSGLITGEGMWNDFVAVFLKNEVYSAQFPCRIQSANGRFHTAYNPIIKEESISHSNVPDYELIMKQKNTIEQLVQSSENQCQQLESISSELSRIKDSRSWRITKPLRVLKRSTSSTCTKANSVLQRKLRQFWHRSPLPSRHKALIRRCIKGSPPAYATKPAIPIIKFDSTVEKYVEHQHNAPIDPIVKLIAFYLPQFHPFPENDEWWGKGFTEWYNVGRARQNYEGHYQPHCPIHNGYYDLRVPSVMEEQAKLARDYGIHGFSYYFYWFAGKILMDTPLEMMLANPKVDIPFCLTWANENWTRRWDGQDNDVLIAQDHSHEDSIAFIRHLVKFFNDPRYIRIDGKPVLVVYRANIIPDMDGTAQLWRDEVKRHGIPDLYLICAQSFGIKGPNIFAFNASVEFPPHTAKSSEITEQLNVTNPDFKGRIYSYDQVVSHAVREEEPDYKLFRTPMLSWDNTARKQNDSHSFHGFSLMRYKQWLAAACSNVFRSTKYSTDEKIVFVNAWNEWAEGTHLEPDRKYGYGYLQATYEVMSSYDKQLVSKIDSASFVKKNPYAVVLHIHYSELWPELSKSLENIRHLGFDLFVTTTSKYIINSVRAEFPDAVTELHENRGRDIYPFIKMLETISKLGYRAVCKLHTKMSVYREDGPDIRNQLIDRLIGSQSTVNEIVTRMETNKSLGIIVPENYLIAHNNQNMMDNGDHTSSLCRALGLSFKHDVFPAGSMFWFKPEAIRDLCTLKSSDFDVEHGLVDGTMPHAIERIFCLLAAKSGYTTETC